MTTVSTSALYDNIMARVTLTRHNPIENDWPELQLLNEKIHRLDERLLHHYQDAEIADEKLESLRQMYQIYLENEQNYSVSNVTFNSITNH